MRPLVSGWFFVGPGSHEGSEYKFRTSDNGNRATIEQGRRAARMALKILEGRQPSAIPVDTGSAVVPMFDYRELHRLKVDPDLLPAGAVILHRPPGFVERYRTITGQLLFLFVQPQC